MIFCSDGADDLDENSWQLMSEQTGKVIIEEYIVKLWNLKFHFQVIEMGQSLISPLVIICLIRS